MTSLLDAAISYAKAGFQVFPCKGNKHPLTPNGHKDATTSISVIRGWFTKPDAGTKLAINIPEWAVVLDIDGATGMRSLNNNDFVPVSSATVRTKRGYHYWYEWKGERSPKRVIGLLPNVDLLCNGYAIVPPSDGYTWYESDLSSRDNIEMAPDWLMQAVELDNKFSTGSSRVSPDEWMQEGLPEGRRQTGLFLFACWLRGVPRMTRYMAKVLVADLAKRSEGAGYKKYPDTDALVDRVWATYDGAEELQTDEESRVWTLADLLVEVTDPPQYLIQDMLPSHGYSILFAAQGVGKSVLAAQAAKSVATGTRFLNRFDVTRAGVLVLDLEQDAAGAAERWRKLLKAEGLDQPPANLHLAFNWPEYESGGLKKAGEYVKENPHIRLIVIDTLGQFMEPGSGAGNAYFKDSRGMGQFTKFSNEFDVSILLVHHSRKDTGGVPSTFADAATGSRGITGPAKARWWLRRDDGQDSGTLQVGGKIPESKITLAFDRESLVWR